MTNKECDNWFVRQSESVRAEINDLVTYVCSLDPAKVRTLVERRVIRALNNCTEAAQTTDRQTAEKTRPEWAKRKTFVVVSHYASEPEERLRKQIEQAGGLFCGVVQVPFYNYLGEIGHAGYAVVYQHTEAIDCTLLC